MSRTCRFIVAVTLVAGLLLASVPSSARAEDDSSSGIDANLTIGLLVVVVGVLGWVAWTIEREDKEDRVQTSALLPLYRSSDDDAAIGFLLNQEPHEEEGVIYTAGLAVGRRF